jgi:hypothetical protein
MNLPANATTIHPEAFARAIRSAIKQGIIPGDEGLVLVLEQRIAIEQREGVAA